MSVSKLDEKALFQETLIKTQQKQITDLNKKINDYKLEIENLKTEIRHLRSLSPTAVNELNTKGEKLSNEKIIALQEISKLKDISDERPLTWEEVRMYDVLTKTLKSFDVKTENKKMEETLTTEELLNALKTANDK